MAKTFCQEPAPLVIMDRMAGFSMRRQSEFIFRNGSYRDCRLSHNDREQARHGARLLRTVPSRPPMVALILSSPILIVR